MPYSLDREGVGMYPVNNIDGIKMQEEELEGSHAIILLFVKPSDDNADSIIKKFNYLHYKSKEYCSIYLIGYSQYFYEKYTDAQDIPGTDNTMWQYSDQCFIEVCEQLERRLKHWTYSGEPELIILQNSSSYENGATLDFRNYHYIDINYGIEKGYIDSFPRFMERIIKACRSETDARSVVSLANRKRLNGRTIIEKAIESNSRIPAPVKDIIRDVNFFKTYRGAA